MNIEKTSTKLCDKHLKSGFDLESFNKKTQTLLKMAFEQGATCMGNHVINKWNSVDIHPKLGGEYNVSIKLEDGYKKLITATYEFDAIKKIWTDPVTDIVSTCVVCWQDLPKPFPFKLIVKKKKKNA